jgi:hypothetical protein
MWGKTAFRCAVVEENAIKRKRTSITPFTRGRSTHANDFIRFLRIERRMADSTRLLNFVLIPVVESRTHPRNVSNARGER